jgi:sugar/nucleoside kinase (ribokinase family)
VAGKLLCFGDLCVDVVGRVDHSETGADITLDHLSVRPGGGAVNCAVAAAAEGVAVEVMGVVGEDLFGEMVLSHLTKCGVGTQFVRRMSGRTGTVISLVDAAGQTRFYSYRGVNAEAYGRLPALPDYLCVSGYSFQDGESRRTAQAMLASGVPCALDPSFQFARDFCAQRLAVEFLLPNLEEARLMSGRSSPEECAAALRQLGVRTVVIKLGADGCYVQSDGLAELVRGEAVSAVDTTGAGDAFAGAFLACILKGHGLVEAARRANACAGKVVSTPRS